MCNKVKILYKEKKVGNRGERVYIIIWLLG